MTAVGLKPGARGRRFQRRTQLGRSTIAMMVASILACAASGASAQTPSCANPPAALSALQLDAAGPAAPPLSGTFLDGAGRVLTLEGFRGRGVVINFWATWCPPCVEEMPALDRLQAALTERRGPSSVAVVAASADLEGAAAVTPFFAKNAIMALEVYVDSRGRLASVLGVQGLPTTVLVAGDGREVGRVVGIAEWDDPEAIDYIHGCLSTP